MIVKAELGHIRKLFNIYSTFLIAIKHNQFPPQERLYCTFIDALKGTKEMASTWSVQNTLCSNGSRNKFHHDGNKQLVYSIKHDILIVQMGTLRMNKTHLLQGFFGGWRCTYYNDRS